MIFKRINVSVIPHSEQRYPTVGDWIYNEPTGYLDIRVSQMSDPRYCFLVARHELDEAMLCIDRGITEKEVTAFDLWYEKRREMGDTECQGECGNHPNAPYRAEHFFATTAERMMAAELGIDWEKYDAEVMSL